MRKPIALLLIMAVIVAIAYVTKPSDEKCIAEAKNQFRQHMLNGAASALAGKVNPSLFSYTLEKAFAESLVVKDKFLYKEIDQQKANNTVRIGWAAFGTVQVSLQ